jgi:hypothetical protein
MCSVIRWQSKVETQNFASHKQGCAINRGDYIPFIAGFTARETQDFASLLGCRRHCFKLGVPLYYAWTNQRNGPAICGRRMTSLYQCEKRGCGGMANAQDLTLFSPFSLMRHNYFYIFA